MIFFKRLALITALVGSLVGCSQSDEPTPPTTSNEVNSRFSLRLNVEVNSSGAPSRADINPIEFQPLPGEGFEEIATLRVIIFDPDGTTVKGNRMVRMSVVDGKLVPVNDNLIFPVESNELLYVYLIANEASLPLPSAVAGAGSYTTVSQWLDTYRVNTPGENLLNQLDGWTVGYPASGPVTSIFASEVFNTEAEPRLPMTERFRLLTDQDKAVIAGSSTEADGSLVVEYMQETSLFIAPAAAKVTFEFDFKSLKSTPGVSGVNVTGIRLSGLGQTEYVFPNSTVYTPSKYSLDKEDNPIIGTVNPVEGYSRYITSFAVPTVNNGSVNLLLEGNAFEAVPMTYASNEAKRGPYYFPEVLTQSAANAFQVEVQIEDDAAQGGHRWLTAQPLTENILLVGGNEAIARATHLRIIISFNDFGLTWEVVEAPYNSVVLTPSFGFTDDQLKNKNNN